MHTTIHDAERVGPAFSEDAMLAARHLTRVAIQTIAKDVQPGMREEDAVEHATQVLSDLGLHATWHPVRVRFGANTVKAMKQPSAPGVVLQENDIFFVDIAPATATGKEMVARASWWATTQCSSDAQETRRSYSTRSERPGTGTPGRARVFTNTPTSALVKWVGN